MNELVIHPGDFIREKYVAASGKSMPSWAKEVGIPYQVFWKIVTRQHPISIPVSISLSKRFVGSPQWWIRKQNEFLLTNYLTEKCGDKPIPRLMPMVVINAHRYFLRDLLLNDFLKPRNLKISDLSSHMRVNNEVFRKYVHGERPITYEFAGRLGEALGTGPRFWLNLKAKQEVDFLLETNPHLSKYFDCQWNFSTSRNESPALDDPERPGKVLLEKFILPSGIGLSDWADFLCVGARTLQRVIDGKNEMDLKFISLLVKAFDRKASYWIDLQNNYLGHQYIKNSSRRPAILPIGHRLTGKLRDPLIPGTILKQEFLKPLKIRLVDFAKHIRIGRVNLKHLLQGRDRIDISLAVKLSQALGTSPMYWLDLQMKYDFSRAETNIIARRKGHDLQYNSRFLIQNNN